MSVESSEDKNWRRLKEQYLKQIENVLTESGQPNARGIIDDVRSHLDRRFAELGPQQQTPENFQNIIAAMGPASDYAELLNGKPLVTRFEIGISRRFFINAALSITIIATLVLFAQIANRYFPSKKVFTTQPMTEGSFAVDTYMSLMGRYADNIKYPFVDDPNAIGKWVSVDFVNDPQEFTPEQKRWRWNLWFKEITFYKDGTTNWAWNWTKGLLLHRGGDHTASHYIIKTIDGEQYLFFEWKSGDYIILHRKPMYYVFKKETETAAR